MIPVNYTCYYLKHEVHQIHRIMSLVNMSYSRLACTVNCNSFNGKLLIVYPAFLLNALSNGVFWDCKLNRRSNEIDLEETNV